MNFYKDLLVFVISTNEETTEDAIKSLKSQNCNFEIKIIKNKYPMSKAFQEMPNNCDKKYFIQLDADMILKNDAIIFLYEKIKKSPFWIYRISGSLYEEGFGIGGAVKCWKKSIFNFFSFKDVRTVDRNFHNRAKFFGFKIKHYKKILGTHRPRHSNFSLYLKSKSDIEKWKYLKRPYNIYAKKLIDEIINTDNVSFYRLMGALFGSINSFKNIIRSKNIDMERKYYEFINNIFDFEKQNKEFKINNKSKKDISLLVQNNYNDFNCNNRNIKLELLDTIFNITNINQNYRNKLRKKIL